MTKKYGTDYPDKVDLIAEKDGACYLYVVQSDEMDDEKTLALQDKLNNYCGGQVFSDTSIDCCFADSRSKALGDKFPSVECSRVQL